MDKDKVIAIWERKLVKFGNSFYIALPPAYLKSLKIGKGKTLKFELHSNGCLFLRGEEK
jgi:antitoxin component of MazEF toxin-antitoxin module